MAIGSPQWMYSSGSEYQIEQSLRFNDDDTAYLSRTPASASNQRTFTFSAWVKRGNIGGEGHIFDGSTGADSFYLRFDSDDILRFSDYAESGLLFKTNAKYRDCSAWYHILLAVDTTQSTESNRVKFYVNGEQVTSWHTATYPSQNDDTGVNGTTEHRLGIDTSGGKFDGYLGEVNFIDGSAKAPADFGETGDYGEWKPRKYSGSYGTNGFYLPFKQDYTVEGFSTVTYKGNSGTQYIGGTGFNPNFIWIKKRDGSDNHALYNSLTPNYNYLRSNTTDSQRTNGQLSAKTDGFLLSNGDGSWNASNSYVAWNWDMGSNFYGTTAALTAQGNAQHSTSQNKIGASSIYLDGTGDYINVADNEKWDVGTADFTIEMWAKIATNSGDYSGLLTMGSPQVSFRINAQGRIQFLQDHGGTRGMTTDSSTTGTNLRDNAWHHLAVVRQGTNWNLYVDGVSEYSGTGMSGNISSIDNVYIGRRVDSGSHYLTGYLDEIRVSNNARYTSTFNPPTTAFNNDGNTLLLVHSDTSNGSTTFTDSSGSTLNTNGSINSIVAANPTYGQSIVSWTGNSTGGASVGHGLSSSPEFIIIKNRTSSNTQWRIQDTLSNKRFIFDTDAGSTGYRITFSSSTFTFDSDSGGHTDWNGNGNEMIAYCFHSVTGYSKIGSYTGNGSNTGTVVTTGFRPAFLLIKNTAATAQWYLYDSVREPADSKGQPLWPNSSNGNTSYYERLKFTDTGFQLLHTDTDLNGNGTTYIYMAFADKREYAYWLDQSGNNNDWTSNNLTESDISVDSPTNNFNVNNPLDEDYASNRVFSEGNLKVDSPTTNHGNTRGTIGMNSGKWYMEWNVPTATGGSNAVWSGVCASDNDLTAFRSVNQWNNHASNGNSIVRDQAVEDWSDGGVAAGTIWQVAVDMDNKKIWLGENNVWWGSSGHATDGNPSTAANPTATFSDSDIPDGNLYSYTGGYDLEIISNYGQDSSFAGTKTAQGNQDSGGVGDFYYTPPSGFKALCTKNLPDVAVVPSEHFNTVLYNGSSSTPLAVTGVGFSPDFTWLKARSEGWGHGLFSRLNGTGAGSGYKYLFGNSTAAESDLWGAITFDSDGFTGVSSSYNGSFAHDFGGNGQTFVSWNWKANGSGSANTNGSINSTVSANVDAGFSIVSFNGNATAGATVGHGLSSAPEMYIVKSRTTSATDWWTYHASTGATHSLRLNNTSAAYDDNTIWNDTAPTNAVFSLGNYADINKSGEPLIAYCFHSVDGYSKVGSYVGNSNADGTFVYTGFKPAYVMVKNTSGWGWYIHDSAREPNNENDVFLLADSNAADSATDNSHMDFLSNGFKLRTSSVIGNGSSYTLIYIAFAETPFKYSNAN